MNLQGKKGLIIGLANDQSIAWGCAKAYASAGAELTITYQGEKTLPHVEKLAEQIGARLVELDVRNDEDWDSLFETIDHLDFALHSVAFAPKADLHGKIYEASLKGFQVAMSISCYSFIEMTRRCVDKMPNGGSVLTLSYYGAQRVVDNYNLMGPVKAALEATVREISCELGEKQIRVNALSPGPIATRAASGLAHFDKLMELAAERAPLHTLTTIEDVGAYAAFLAADSGRHVTGQTLLIDAGYSVRG